MTNKLVVWKQELTVKFWRDNDEIIPDHHLEALKKAGFDHAHAMMRSGFTSGELVENICAVSDPEEGIDYSGWWELSIQENYNDQQYP